MTGVIRKSSFRRKDQTEEVEGTAVEVREGGSDTGGRVGT